MNYLKSVERLLDMSPAEKARVMAELEAHWVDLRDELIASGTNQMLAEQLAERRLGMPEDVAARLSAVHNSATWKSALLAAVPFLAPLFLLISQPYIGIITPGVLLMLILFGVLLVGSVRELAHGRRTIWLASWLGASFSIAMYLPGLLRFAPPNPAFIKVAHSVMSIIPTMCLVVGIWSNRKWRIPAIALLVFSLCPPLFITAAQGQSLIPMLFMFGAWIAQQMLVVMFAWQIFGRHPYGNAAQTSLFAIVYCGFANISGLNIWLLVAVIVLKGLLVILFARVSQWQHKLITGLAFGYVFGLQNTAKTAIWIAQTSPQRDILTLGLIVCATAAVYAIVFAIPVVAPFVIERLGRRKDQMQIAQ